MTIEDDATGRVTICSLGQSVVFADDAGVTVRGFHGRTRVFPWSDISGFADGTAVGWTADAFRYWVLEIVLRSGRTYSVACTRARSADPRTLAAVRHVAERYGKPADLTGVQMRNGLPPGPGLYEDPAGQAGVRYWDGSLWSPLLSRVGPSVHAHHSAARWAELPVAAQPWTYPSTQAARAMLQLRLWALLTGALLVAALVLVIQSRSRGPAWILGSIGCLSAVFLSGRWAMWYQWSQLDKRAKAPHGQLN